MKSDTDSFAATALQGFAALELAASLTDTLAALGYEEPTPIQREAIPALVAGRDVLGQAATGTGKTAAFALPILQRIAGLPPAERKRPSALILVPTRELAMQVAEAVHSYGKSLGAQVLPIYGGQAMAHQLRALRRGVDVVVATPGRVLDHLRRGSVDFGGVRAVVLDEADEMLDMGFAEDLEAILTALPKQRQTALFSATIPPRIAAIARAHLRDPLRVTIAREIAAPGKQPRLREVAYVVPRQHKIEALGRVLDMESPSSALVFCRTRTEVDELTERLGSRGYAAESLHGGMSQEQRDRVMRRFRDETTQLLIATDVAARGLDISHLSHVVNFDIPSSPEAYVHRTGRTGRAGREGVAITLLEPRELRLLRSIEQSGRRKVAIESVPTVLDIRARRMEATSAELRAALEAGEFASYRVVVSALADDYDPLDIAAAAVKLAHLAKAPDLAEVEIPSPPLREERPNAGGSRGRIGGAGAGRSGGGVGRGRNGVTSAGGEAVRAGGKRPIRPAAEGDPVRIFIPLGRLAGMRPADLVGAIANEAGVPSRQIGAIEIADTFSLVEVPESAADTIIEALRKTKIRGKTVKVRRDRA
jgi:ATP-dependent RNA helicase DeaD